MEENNGTVLFHNNYRCFGSIGCYDSVVGNVKTFDAIRNEIKVIDEHLLSIKSVDEFELEKLESLRMILEILDGFYKSCDSKKCCKA